MKTFEEILKYGVEGYPIDMIVNNLMEEDLLDCLKEFVHQYREDIFNEQEEKKVIKNKIYLLNEEEYYNLLHSGMFWEFYPEATGNYVNDVNMSKNGDFPFEKPY